MDQATPAHQGVLRHFGQCGEDAGLDRRLGLRVHRHRAQSLRLPGQLVRMATARSEEHTSELQSLSRISYAVICLTKKKDITSLIHSQTSEQRFTIYTRK